MCCGGRADESVLLLCLLYLPVFPLRSYKNKQQTDLREAGLGEGSGKKKELFGDHVVLDMHGGYISS